MHEQAHAPHPAARPTGTPTTRRCASADRCWSGSIPQVEWLAAPRGRRGRPATFPDAAIQTCLTRDGHCSAWRCGRRRGWWRACRSSRDWTGRCRTSGHALQAPEGPERRHPPVVRAGEPCTCWSTAPAIKAVGEGEWTTRKHGASRPRRWRKVHLGIDAGHEGGSGDRDHGEPRRRRADAARVAGTGSARGAHRQPSPQTERTTRGPATRPSPPVGPAP